MTWLIVLVHVGIGLAGGAAVRRLGGPPRYETWTVSGDYRFYDITGWRVETGMGRIRVETLFWVWLLVWPAWLIAYLVVAAAALVAWITSLTVPNGPKPAARDPILAAAEHEVDRLLDGP